jgi:uncharacterized protein DUF4236
MGFRFRRSVKLIPGLRLNLSKSGVSLTAGVPGAHLNFSPRGARTTFGVPGSGFSWSQNLNPGQQTTSRCVPPESSERFSPIRTSSELEQTVNTPGHKVVYRRSGRKLSAQQVNSAYRRLALNEWIQKTQAQINQSEADLVERLNSWREMPSILSDDDYQTALKTQPFKYETSRPAASNYQQEQIVFKQQILDSLEQEIPRMSILTPAALAIAGVIAGMLIIIVAGLLVGWIGLALILSVAGVTGGGVLYSIRKRARNAQMATLSSERLRKQWPEKEEELRKSYQAEVAQYEAVKTEAERRWKTQEQERIAWASKLISGDEATIHDAVCQTLADLDFPFETQTAFAVEDAKTSYLHLDLPEIENVVPSTKYEVLKAGRVKEGKRNESERQAAYCTVACGAGLMMASAAFAAAPTLETIQIAAYTQRQQKGNTLIDDDYVYVVSIPRTTFTQIDGKSVNPALLMSKLGGRMELQANYRFKKLTDRQIPSWVSEFRPTSHVS